MTQIPNIITLLRVAGSIGLLFYDVTSGVFWIIYSLCGISDIADGWLARKLHAESKTGAVLDLHCIVLKWVYEVGNHLYFRTLIMN